MNRQYQELANKARATEERRKKRYRELAQQASRFEQRGNYEEAGKFWNKATEFAIGMDRKWVRIRLEFCCQQISVHPLAFLDSFAEKAH